jgi:hypothetical protein
MEEEEAMDVVSFWLGVRRRLEVKGRGGEGKGSCVEVPG